MSELLEDLDDSLESMSVSQSNGTLHACSRRGSPQFGDFTAFTSPVVDRGMQRVSVIGPSTSQMVKSWSQKRASISPHAMQQNSAPQMMEYLEDRRRRASRAVSSAALLRQDEDDQNIESLTAEINELRETVEKQRGYIIEMADMGQGLVVEIDDLRNSIHEAESERGVAERKVESQRREIDELNLSINRLKQELLSREGEHYLKSVEELNKKVEQSSALNDLRRSQLIHDRVERARALNAVATESPEIVEECLRTQIQQDQAAGIQQILFWFLDDSRSLWRNTVSDMELIEISLTSIRQQMTRVLEARLRAESLAAQHSEIADDLRRSLTSKEAAIKQLQSKLTATRVSHYVKTDLTPTVKAALDKVHSLNSVITKIPTTPLTGDFHTPVRQIHTTRQFGTA